MKKLMQLLGQIKQFVDNHRKQVVAIGGVAVALIALAILLASRGCAGSLTRDPGTKAPSAVIYSSTSNRAEERSAAAKEDGSPGELSSEVEELGDSGSAASEPASLPDVAQAGTADNTPNAPAQSTNDAVESTPPPAPSNKPASTPVTAAPEKHWVADYAQVWVEDSPAWEETIPLYDYVEKSICNVCGTDITGNEVAHSKAHMMAGEGSGHHTEVIQTVIGNSTIHHDATGHYETVESGGHWE